MKFAMATAFVAALLLIAQGADAQQACNPDRDDCDNEPPTADTCLENFKRSPAAQTCVDMTAGVEGTNCRLKASCQTSDSNWRVSRATVFLHSVHTVQNCNGRLREGLC